ncbi:MAG: pentapeptide repeat-containing protein [Candidatus Sedimenticola sp. PURPLELP]
MNIPQIKNDPLYQLLRDGHIDEFNKHLEAGEHCDLQGTDLRGLDMRNIHTDGLDLSNCYLRQADLRGLDLSRTNLEGASIIGAKISGTFFPKALSAEEISLSLLHGTRMRYR